MVDDVGDDHRNRNNAPRLWDFDVGAVELKIGPLALQRTVQESLHPLVDPAAQAADLTFRYPLIPIACTRSSTERVETSWM